MVLTLNQKNVIWDNVLDEVKKQINDRHLFDSFIADTKIYKIEGNKMFISTGSKLSCQFLNSNDHYLEIIKNSLKKATETEYEITFISKDEIKENTKILSNEQKNTFFSSCSLNPKYTFDNFVVGPCNKEAVKRAFSISSIMRLRLCLKA